MLFRASPGVRALRARPSALASPRLEVDYLELLRWRGHLPADELVPTASPVQVWRERKDRDLVAQRCTRCGALQYPRRRICRGCRAKDAFEDVELARTGVVFTYTVDHLYPGPGGSTAMVVVDLDGGGRVLVQATDLEASALRIGLPVELCLRRLHRGGGFNNYFWKARQRGRGE
jgi:uncharacterized OB-fold protein